MIIPDEITLRHAKYFTRWRRTSWSKERALWWHRCSKTNKIIWPGQMAMLGQKIDIEVLPVPIRKTWITLSAYTYMQLTGKDKE
jgi:hypothetical protein